MISNLIHTWLVAEYNLLENQGFIKIFKNENRPVDVIFTLQKSGF